MGGGGWWRWERVGVGVGEGLGLVERGEEGEMILPTPRVVACPISAGPKQLLWSEE